MTSATQTLARPASALSHALLSLALGLGLIAMAGFAGPDILHAAAHDGRHTAAFPCH